MAFQIYYAFIYLHIYYVPDTVLDAMRCNRAEEDTIYVFKEFICNFYPYRLGSPQTDKSILKAINEIFEIFFIDLF